MTVGASATYEPFGALSGFAFGNGLTASLTYDQDYQLTGISTTDGTTPVQNLTNGYDASGNITSITDAISSSRSQTLTYDDLNRLYTASGLYGSQSYSYDGVGNRLTRVVGSTTDTYAYSPTANRISTVTTGSNVRSFSYLASGQVSQDVRDPSDTYTFAANDNGRNASASLNSSTVGSYLYNAFEQRVQKVAGSITTQFVFDRFGHLLAEANASGVTQREYIWLDDLPVAVVDDTGASPVIYFIHTDQLGTPQKITDGTKTVVWDGAFDPFGNPASVTGTLTSNLRFPGQYLDSETVLNQNWNRDYDPTIGRYIQSDPIGLDAGSANTYLYAAENPAIFFDPTGTTLAGRIAGGEFGRWFGGIVGGAGGEAIEPVGGGVPGAFGGRELGGLIGAEIGDALTNAINAMVPAGLTPAEQAEYAKEYNAYKKICDEQPPSGLCRKDLDRWNLNKAKNCKKLRQDFADKWWGGKFDAGHAAYMQQLERTINNLTRKLGL